MRAVVAKQIPIGETVRRLLHLLDRVSADEIRNQLRWLPLCEQINRRSPSPSQSHFIWNHWDRTYAIALDAIYSSSTNYSYCPKVASSGGIL